MTERGPDVPRQSREGRDPRVRFSIDVELTALKAMSDVAWKAMQANNDPARYFAADVGAVEVVRQGDVPTVAKPFTIDRLTGVSARTAYWHKQTRSGNVEKFPLQTVIRDMLANYDPPLPRLERIVRAPCYGPNMDLVITPGYDPVTGYYYAAEGLEVAPPPAEPTTQQLAAAKLLILDELFGDMPFVSQSDRAHAVSLLLNPFVRSMIDGPTPLYMIESPTPGSGKTLLARVASLPAIGADPVMIVPSKNNEEMRKTITAQLMDLPEAVLIDNVSGELRSEPLLILLTSQYWHDRILGRSEKAAMKVHATLIATGNNPTATGEMIRRWLRIRIDAGIERPEHRANFRIPFLRRWAAEHRGELITAALTLVNHWIAQGSNFGSGVLGMYEDWSGIHSGILEAADIPGFLAKRDDEAVVASQDATLLAFVTQWREEHKRAEQPASELLKVAQKIDGFYLGQGASERAQVTSLGMTLNANRDRVVAGCRIRQIVRQGRSYYSLDYTTAEEAPF